MVGPPYKIIWLSSNTVWSIITTKIPFQFNLDILFKVSRNNPSHSHQYQSKHSYHTNSKQISKQLYWLQFKYILLGQPIKLSTVASLHQYS